MGETFKQRKAIANTFIIPQKKDEDRNFIEVNDDLTVTLDITGYALVPTELMLDMVSREISDE